MLHVKSLIIVDDCRFENEFDALPEALRIRLEAREEVRRLRADSWREDVFHPSETGLDKYCEEGKFDLVFNTEDEKSIDNILETIFSALGSKNDAEEEN